MYRRALTPPVSGSTTQAAQPLADQGVEASIPTRTSGYGWSRWWRRGQSAVPASQPPPAPPQAVTTGKESSAEVPAAVSEASSNPVSPTSTAASPPATDSAKPIESTTNFAKTLRLSSDQLVSRSDWSQSVSSWAETTQAASRPKHRAILSHLILLWRSYVLIPDLFVGEYRSDSHFRYRRDYHQVGTEVRAEKQSADTQIRCAWTSLCGHRPGLDPSGHSQAIHRYCE